MQDLGMGKDNMGCSNVVPKDVVMGGVSPVRKCGGPMRRHLQPEKRPPRPKKPYCVLNVI